jgi:hypothetical protein
MNVSKKNNILGLISGIVATIWILSCKSDERQMMQIPSSSDTVYAIQHSNAIRLIDSVKIWKSDHPGEPYTFSVIDSFAQNSIFTGHDYQLPGSSFYFITYVKDDSYEVLYCPERRDNEINMPYFLATPDTVYVLKY